MFNHEQQAILAAVLQTAVDAIIIIDERGIIESVNPATEQMFGFTSDDMIGQNVKMLMPSPYRHEHDDYLQRYRETEERRIIGIGREVTGQRKDGSMFPLHLAVSEVDAGERKLFAGIIRDISDLKDVESELKQLNVTLDGRVHEQAKQLHAAQTALLEKEKFATLGRISGGIAHEIRNPLNAIKTSAYYLLNATAPTEEKRLEHLTRIDRQVSIIDGAVTALSDLARLPEPDRVECDVATLMRQLIHDRHLPSNVAVSIVFAEDVPNVLCDEKQLWIAFANLVCNARDAMPNGGTLTIRGYAEADRSVVSVRDTGSGMSPETLSRIGEPFFSTKARGMGLGMAITKAILDKNQCTMRVETELDRGTTFYVSLPPCRVTV